MDSCARIAPDRLPARNPLRCGPRSALEEMRQADSATIDSATIESPARREFSRPLQIFAAIFVVAALVYSFQLGADSLGASEAYSAWAAAKPSAGAIVR